MPSVLYFTKMSATENSPVCGKCISWFQESNPEVIERAKRGIQGEVNRLVNQAEKARTQMEKDYFFTMVRVLLRKRGFGRRYCVLPVAISSDDSICATKLFIEKPGPSQTDS